MTDCILVAGGAGYIGAHVSKALAAAGMMPVVLDDLSSGRRETDKIARTRSNLIDLNMNTPLFTELLLLDSVIERSHQR
jgi:UDP-glucose 4-epimerase